MPSDIKFNEQDLTKFLTSNRVRLNVNPPLYRFKQARSIISLRNYFMILIGILMVIFNVMNNFWLTVMGFILAGYPTVEYWILRRDPELKIDVAADTVQLVREYRWQGEKVIPFDQIDQLEVHRYSRYGDANPFTDSATDYFYEYVLRTSDGKEWLIFQLKIRDSKADKKVADLLHWLQYLVNQ